MPEYRQSKSQNRSQSKSKNGGRRRKRTLKNVRRRKSRKVMMGGATKIEIMKAYDDYPQKGDLIQQLNTMNKMVIDRDTLEMAVGYDATFAAKVQKLLGLP